MHSAKIYSGDLVGTKGSIYHFKYVLNELVLIHVVWYLCIIFIYSR